MTQAGFAKGEAQMQQASRNAAAAQSVALGDSNSCPFCKRIGLPILPLRYAVIPGYLQAGRGKRTPEQLGLPGGIGQLNQAPELRRHRYTIRTLRAGFLHVYLGKPGQWQIYSVTARGCLRLIQNPDDLDAHGAKEMTTVCEREGHNIPASFIHVQDPERTPVIWLAFSDVAWTAKVRQQTEKQLAERMQRVDIRAISAEPFSQPDAMDVEREDWMATMVEEYPPATPASGLSTASTDRQAYQTLEIADLAREFKRWDGLHGFETKPGMAALLAAYARQYREGQGKGKRVAAVVLNDAMGAIQEVNSERMAAVTHMAEYEKRHARARRVSESIDGIKKIIETGVLRQLTVKEEKEGTPDKVTHVYEITDSMGMPIDAVEYTSTRAERAAKKSKDTWDELRKNIDESKKQQFDQMFDAAREAFSKQIAACDQDWAKLACWPIWQLLRKDYDPSDNRNCSLFVQNYALALAGGIAGDDSYSVWEKWLNQPPDSPENPVYAALLFNQKSLLQYLMPGNGDINKADKIYDAIKEIFGTNEVFQFFNDAFNNAVTNLQMAIASALGKLHANAGAAGAAALQAADQVAQWANMAAINLYTGVEVTQFRVTMKLGVYQRLLVRLMSGAVNDLGQAATYTVKQGARVARNALVSGMLHIRSATVRSQMVEVLFWTTLSANQIQAEINTLTQQQTARLGQLSRTLMHTNNQVRKAVDDALHKAQLRVTIGSRQFRQAISRQSSSLQAGIALSQQQAQTLVFNLMNKSLRGAAAGGNIVLATGSLVLQIWALRDGLREMDKTLGDKAIEAQLAMMSSAIGVVGAGVAVLGELGDVLKFRPVKNPVELIRWGGVVMAASGLVDAVQSAFAAARTWKVGDASASKLYIASAVLYVGAAAFSGAAAWSGLTSIFGPVGIALVLLAGGVLLTWMAINAERTPLEIWLDRCYFGKGERKEGRWTDNQAAEEANALNAIISGVSATLTFADSWLSLAEKITGYEKLEIEIRIADFDADMAAHEWQVDIQARDGRIYRRILAGQHQRPRPPLELRPLPDNYRPSIPKRELFRGLGKTRASIEAGALLIKDEVEISTDILQGASLLLQYWPDKELNEQMIYVDLKTED